MGQTALIIFIVLATFIFVVFVTGLFIFIYQYRKRKIVHESEKQLIAMNSIIQGQEAERSRMAKDLHDGLGGMLSGIKLNLSALKGNLDSTEKEWPLFNKSIVQLDKAIAEMRRVAHNMMPEALLKLGLTEAIQDYCDGINESNTITTRFTAIGPLQAVAQPVSVILYRIIQELTNNAIKYGAPKNIFVQLNRHDKGVTLTVEDDGKGFNTSQTSTGTGLQNVRTRVDYLKGSMDIHSEAQQGTSVTVEIPL